ncbi:predicted protein [Naegleria gruberi]|uniref:Predicted protein n=1 Tax=Naegleria gruberi TaxID=5762 RepID=D2VDN8_NAEGR|nr:uncharacterized protein NAEGRDRAFT_48701 [Naegleria gruberi]EFC45033.1 predicted protein [Naegleria gruberi]|eukprot:XP_002677777.1 predicted protein [Naegleria gruberi strain NEG-M]
MLNIMKSLHHPLLINNSQQQLGGLMMMTTKMMMMNFHTHQFHSQNIVQKDSQVATREIFDSGLKGGITERQIALDFYDQLEPVSTDFMIGRWKGSEFRTNHPMDNMLDISGWYGKMFQDTENVHPLLFYESNSRDLFAVNPDRVVAGMTLTNVPRTPFVKKIMLWLKPFISIRKSKARLRMTEFRGKVSATMVYDTQPINDVFRKVDENTVLGVMDLKGMKEPYFFVLQRDDHNVVKVDVE